MIQKATLISADESELIRYLLALRNPLLVKSGLQRLCALYEDDKIFRDRHEHRLLVLARLGDPLAILRRWAYKAISWLGSNDDVATVLSHLRSEGDSENRTWAIAAIVKLAGDRPVGEICERAGLDSNIPLMLAARLFAHQGWLKANPEVPVINVDIADPLTLKWASLLAGYGRAPAHLFHPRCENRELLGQLNLHNEPEVSEYSVWALWQNSRFGVEDMAIQLQNTQRQPKNVRRWINRLVTKDASYLARNIDVLDELRRDSEFAAREGLALGVRTIFIPEIPRHILEWHAAESEEVIRELLLEHMAWHADPQENADYAAAVRDAFDKAGPASGTRKRLLAASEQKPLHALLKGVEARQAASAAGLTLTLLAETLIVAEKVNMTTFQAGGNIIGQNLVGGDMINSANASVQRLSVGPERQTLESILKFLKETNELSEAHKAEIASAVAAIGRNGTQDAKKGLLAKLEEIASAVGTVSGAGTALLGFASALGSLFGF